MDLPVRLMGHNCEEEIEKIQEALDVIEGLINSIKTKNPDAEIVLDSNYNEGLFLVLGTRPIWIDHENGGCWEHNYCHEDVIHRFSDCGIVATEMKKYSDYHDEYPLKRYW